MCAAYAVLVIGKTTAKARVASMHAIGIQPSRKTTPLLMQSGDSEQKSRLSGTRITSSGGPTMTQLTGKQ